MATTSIWAIKERLDHVIDYTTNPSKTSKEAYSELHNVIEYAKASYKTEEQLYVTAINCDKDSIHEDMLRTKRRYSKTNGILGFHAFQSFAKGEVTPEIAHEVGVKLANELWGDRFEVVVTTHINTNHIHNHFCLNSVSFKDGKKYYDDHRTYALMRETSDRLCEEYGLHVLLQEEKYNKYATSSVYKELMKGSIDYAIANAKDYNEFIKILQDLNYIVTDKNETLSIRRDPYKKNTRIERQFGKKYSKENIYKRILETQSLYPYSSNPLVLIARAYENYKKQKEKHYYKKGIKAKKGLEY